ncbi:MAG: BlaI/MecI/CopY family transcriptional regulator [Verrucomicrobiaceae bacterium]|nr:MAG: BlaI/MecI/CopY family transcriptional regulator [Verrucomicrobiaceae bacterium]
MPSKPSDELPKLTPGELEIMNEVWNQQPAQVSDLTAAVNTGRAEPLSRTTVLKTIQRLEEKGWLVRDPGRPARYKAVRPRGEARKTLLHAFRERVFNGSAVSLVRCLLDSETLSREEISELQELINTTRQTQP